MRNMDAGDLIKKILNNYWGTYMVSPRMVVFSKLVDEGDLFKLLRMGSLPLPVIQNKEIGLDNIQQFGSFTNNFL